MFARFKKPRHGETVLMEGKLVWTSMDPTDIQDWRAAAKRKHKAYDVILTNERLIACKTIPAIARLPAYLWRIAKGMPVAFEIPAHELKSASIRVADRDGEHLMITTVEDLSYYFFPGKVMFSHEKRREFLRPWCERLTHLISTGQSTRA